jgi:hypothetical protein
LLLIQCLNSTGWAKTPVEVYNAGRLLSGVIPEVDVSWIKSDVELATVSVEDKRAYQAHDKAFASKIVEFPLTDKDRDMVRKCLEATAVRLPPNKYSAALLQAFGFHQ